jgi:hypothetical protein
MSVCITRKRSVLSSFPLVQYSYADNHLLPTGQQSTRFTTGLQESRSIKPARRYTEGWRNKKPRLVGQGGRHQSCVGKMINATQEEIVHMKLGCNERTIYQRDFCLFHMIAKS